METKDLARLYGQRFNSKEALKKNELWKVLCSDFFQKFIPEDSVVLDVAAGNCEFINNIKAARKYALDLNPDVRRFASPDVDVHLGSALDLGFLQGDSVDVVFVSNFLEHLNAREEVLSVLSEARRVCKPNGKLMVLQPNIRYAYKQYWDFFDHRIPISDRSLGEALTISGFMIVRLIPRFLPYTTKSRLPQSPALVRLYLTFPFAWRVFGQQAFAVAEKHA